ncbi:MAG: hypothetical protein IPK33_22070 [Gemmatimonadetes bacterium]|nr:hypothetical protein [Gemmatimonadota bacterium]
MVPLPSGNSGVPPAAPLSAGVIGRMAEAAHDVFCEAMRARGYRYASVTDEAQRTHSALRPFAELADDEQEQNRRLARAIPGKLRKAGYAVVPLADGAVTSPDFPGTLLELLAEDEHARWVRAKLADGWCHAPVTDKPQRQHASLVRWRISGERSPSETFTPAELALMGPGELSEEEREKDRIMVRGIPRMLAAAGLQVKPIDATPFGEY